MKNSEDLALDYMTKYPDLQKLIVAEGKKLDEVNSIQAMEKEIETERAEAQRKLNEKFDARLSSLYSKRRRTSRKKRKSPNPIPVHLYGEIRDMFWNRKISVSDIKQRLGIVASEGSVRHMIQGVTMRKHFTEWHKMRPREWFANAEHRKKFPGTDFEHIKQKHGHCGW